MANDVRLVCISEKILHVSTSFEIESLEVVRSSLHVPWPPLKVGEEIILVTVISVTFMRRCFRQRYRV